jgi:hypothetical protein
VLLVLQYAPRADVVVVVLAGRIAHIGSFHDLVTAGVDLTAFIPLPNSIDSQQQPQKPTGTPTEPAGRPKQDQLGGHELVAPLLEEAAASDEAEDGGIGSSSNSIVLQELPSFLKPAMVSGGSFASHKPSKVSAGRDEKSARAADSNASSTQHTLAPDWRSSALSAAQGPASQNSRAAEGAAADGLQLHEAPQKQAVLQQQQDKADDEDERHVLLHPEQQQQQQQQPSPHGDRYQDGEGGSHDDAAAVKGPQDDSMRLKGQLVLQEQRAKGQVKRSVYLAYLGSWGPLLLLPIAVMLGEPESNGTASEQSCRQCVSMVLTCMQLCEAVLLALSCCRYTCSTLRIYRPITVSGDEQFPPTP